MLLLLCCCTTIPLPRALCLSRRLDPRTPPLCPPHRNYHRYVMLRDFLVICILCAELCGRLLERREFTNSSSCCPADIACLVRKSALALCLVVYCTATSLDHRRTLVDPATKDLGLGRCREMVRQPHAGPLHTAVCLPVCETAWSGSVRRCTHSSKDVKYHNVDCNNSALHVKYCCRRCFHVIMFK